METFEQFCQNNVGWDGGRALEHEMKDNYDIALSVYDRYVTHHMGEKGPKIGDIVEFSDGFQVYKQAKIVEDLYFRGKHGMMCVCEQGTSHTDGVHFSTSGGAFKSFHKAKFQYAGKAKNTVWTWGCNGPGASQGIYFTLDVDKWIIPYEKPAGSYVELNGKDGNYPVTIKNPGEWYSGKCFVSTKAFLAWAEYVGYKHKSDGHGTVHRNSPQKLVRKYVTEDEQIPKDGKPLKAVSNGDIRDAWVVTTDDAVTTYVDHRYSTQRPIGEWADMDEWNKYNGNPLGV